MDESINEVVDYDEYAGDNDYDYPIDEDEDYFSEGSGAQEEESDTEYVDVEDTTYDYEDYGVVSAPVDLPLGRMILQLDYTSCLIKSTRYVSKETFIFR